MANKNDADMEEIILGSEKLAIPLALVENGTLFRNVLSLNTWQAEVSDEDKTRLLALLPQFPENDEAEKEETLKQLFSGNTFKFRNPMEAFRKQLKGGSFNPDIAAYVKEFRNSLYKNYEMREQVRLVNVMKEIVVNRQRIIDQATHLPPGAAIIANKPSKLLCQKSKHCLKLKQRAKRRCRRILEELKETCGGRLENSDSSDYSDAEKDRNISSTIYEENLSRITGTFCQYHNNFTGEERGINNDDYLKMLRKHRHRRFYQKEKSWLSSDDIHLEDLIEKYSPDVLSSYMGLKKGSRSPNKLRGRHFNEEDSDAGHSAAILSEELKTDSHYLFAFLAEYPELFCWIRDVMKSHEPKGLTTVEIEEALKTAVAIKFDTHQLSGDDWENITSSALNFLYSGSSHKNLQDHSTARVNFYDSRWHWLSNGGDSDSELLLLHRIFINSQTIKSEALPSSSINDFHQQEAERFANPQSSYTYHINGQSFVVGPVRSTFVRHTGKSKVREHALLITERPPWVNILTLVRDAAARLPKGEGTRAEICNLLHDSSFICADVNEAQLTTVVSGALDRLHYETDPCVKFDVGQKVWVYLHRNRTAEEFEKAHKEQAKPEKVLPKPKRCRLPKSSKKRASELGQESSSLWISTETLPPVEHDINLLDALEQTSLHGIQESLSPLSTASSDSFINVDCLSPASSPPLSGQDVNLGSGHLKHSMSSLLDDRDYLFQLGNKLERSLSADESCIKKRRSAHTGVKSNACSNAVSSFTSKGKSKRGNFRAVDKASKTNNSTVAKHSSKETVLASTPKPPVSSKRRKKNDSLASQANALLTSVSLPASTNFKQLAPVQAKAAAPLSATISFLPFVGNATSLVRAICTTAIAPIGSSNELQFVPAVSGRATGKPVQNTSTVSATVAPLTHISQKLPTVCVPVTLSGLSTLSNSVTKLQSSVSSTADLMRAAISQTVTEVSVEGKMPKKSKPKPSTSKTAVNVPQEIVSSVNKAASEQTSSSSRATVAALVNQLLRTSNLQQLQARPQTATTVVNTPVLKTVDTPLTALQAELIVTKLPGAQGPTALLVPQGLRGFSQSGLQLLATIGGQQQQAAAITTTVTKATAGATLIPAMTASTNLTGSDFTLLLTHAPSLTQNQLINQSSPKNKITLVANTHNPRIVSEHQAHLETKSHSLNQARSRFVSNLAQPKDVTVLGNKVVPSTTAPQLVAAVLGTARLPRPKTVPVLSPSVVLASRPTTANPSSVVDVKPKSQSVVNVASTSSCLTSALFGGAFASASENIISSDHAAGGKAQGNAGGNTVAYLVRRGRDASSQNSYALFTSEGKLGQLVLVSDADKRQNSEDTSHNKAASKIVSPLRGMLEGLPSVVTTSSSSSSQSSS